MAYIDCDVVGPAVFMLVGTGNVIEDCRFDADASEVFVVSNNSIRGTIAITDVAFRRCRFRNVGLVGPKAIVDYVRP